MVDYSLFRVSAMRKRTTAKKLTPSQAEMLRAIREGEGVSAVPGAGWRNDRTGRRFWYKIGEALIELGLVSVHWHVAEPFTGRGAFLDKHCGWVYRVWLEDAGGAAAR